MKIVTLIPKNAGALLKGFALLLGLCSINNAASAQAVSCPPNFDFEQGNYGNWTYEVGYSCPGTPQQGVTFGSVQVFPGPGDGLGIPLTIPATNPNPAPWAGAVQPLTPALRNAGVPIWSRFDTTSSGLSPADTDYYGGFKLNPPGGGNYAMKIGSDTPLYCAERMTYYVHVPPGFNDYSFTFRYAVVLYDGGHPAEDQPVFRIKAYDSADVNKDTLACGFQNYVASASLLSYGFKLSTKSSQFQPYYYLPWTGASLPILNQGGKTIAIEVSALGCDASGHWAYGYFDVVGCGKFKAAVSYCNLDSGIVRFIGTNVNTPYKWYDQQWNYLGTGAYIDVPVPPTPSVFYGVLPTASPGCLDTIVTDTVSDFTISTTPSTPCVQFGSTIQLNTTTSGGLPGTFDYQWNANPELSSEIIPNPIASPIDTTRYYVTVTDRVGCFRRDTVIISQAPNAGPDLAVCPLGERPAQLHVAGPLGADFHWYEYGTSSPGQYLDCTDCQDPVSAPVDPIHTYTVGYDGCPVLDTLVVFHDTTNYIVAPQDLLLVCRPDYRQLLSQAFGPNPKANIPCGTANPIVCAPADQLIATVGAIGTPAKNIRNTPFNTQNAFAKYQFIIKKSELLGAGLYSGTLNSMAFHALASVVGAKAPVSYITVSLGCIDKDDFPRTGGTVTNSSFYQGAQMTDVAYIAGYTITPSGWNTINFDFPYSWDTTKNLVVDLCVGPIGLLDTSIVGVDPVSMVEGRAIQKVSNSINVCGGNAPVVAEYLQRPAVQFNYCPTPDLPFDYTWRPGNNLQDSSAQNPNAYIARSINYAVYSVGRNGCQLRDSLHIYVPEHHVLASPVDTSICEGQPAFLYATGGEAYKWFEVREGAFQDASGSLNCTDCDAVIAMPKQTTTYAIVFSNETNVGNPANPGYGVGCPDTLMITVNVWKHPEVRVLNNDTTITIGQSVPLYVQGAQHFSWSPVGSLSDPNAPMTIATPTQTTSYVATGFDMNGCAYRDTVKVTVNYHGNLLIPTGFTPNGDGLNDVFKIVNPRVQALQEFRVFNRWGQEVFTTTNVNAGWDGTWKGVKQELGTYQYIIRVGYADGLTELYKGDVQLIR
jgi:gliding motility-associated-like protein